MDGVSHNDPEVKKVLVHSMNVEEKVDLLKKLKHSSECWKEQRRPFLNCYKAVHFPKKEKLCSKFDE